MGAGREKPVTPGVDSARRVLHVLLMFSEERPSLTADEIVKHTGISTPSVYRYLSLLKELYLVEEVAYSTYSLTPRVLALGRAAESAFTVSRVIHPTLERLAAATGEAARVLRRLNDYAVCSDMVEVSHEVRLSFAIGHTFPLHRGAAAKVLLAGMGPQWCEAYLARSDPELSATEQATMLRGLDAVRKQGWSHSSAEVDEGIWAVAAPIMAGGRVIAAITVAGPQYRISKAKARDIHNRVLTAARELSAQINGNAD